MTIPAGNVLFRAHATEDVTTCLCFSCCVNPITHWTEYHHERRVRLPPQLRANLDKVRKFEEISSPDQDFEHLQLGKLEKRFPGTWTVLLSYLNLLCHLHTGTPFHGVSDILAQPRRGCCRLKVEEGLYLIVRGSLPLEYLSNDSRSARS